MEPIGYIYLTTCLANGKIYVGKHELNRDKNYIGSGTIFELAVKKYGKENFKRKILRLCYSLHELRIWEHVYIVKHKSYIRSIGYNIAKGDVNTSEYNPAKIPEVREKIRKAAKKRMSNPENTPMYGKHHTEETKKKISETRKCKKIKWTDEARRKMSEQRKGRKMYEMSDETKKKLSEIAKKRFADPRNNPMYGDHRFAGENNPMYGRHHSEETRKHWSEIRKGRKLSEETKKKMSLAHKKKK